MHACVLFLSPMMGTPLGLGGPLPQLYWEEGNLGYEPTREPSAVGNLGVGYALEEARFRSQLGKT